MFNIHQEINTHLLVTLSYFFRIFREIIHTYCTRYYFLGE